ncbi:MAG TPA: DUF1048 domain-containing protein [Actinocrinis sp.]|nr:DUF1048 domain-containing protein [Actinocrinis sp.]
MLGDDIPGFCAALFGGQGAAHGMAVLELIGTDVAAFCDDLIKDSRTYADVYQESISTEHGTAET